jgi:antitoxin ParD1/3/4
MLGREERSMSKFEQLTVALPAEELESVQAAVESGEYASAGEVMRDAIRLWESRRFLRDREIARLRAAYEEGLASGPAGPFDIEEIIAEAEAERSAPKRRSRA